MSFIMNDAKYDFILNDLNVDLDVRNRLSQHLYLTEKGRDDVIVTPIGKDTLPSDLLKEFDTVFNSNSSSLNSTLIRIESEQKEKFGPRSIAVPFKDRIEAIKEGFTPEVSVMDLKIDYRSINRLRPISKDKALTLLKNSTNSGLPYYTKKSLVKDRVLNKFDILLKREDPCIIFTRTQEQSKTRTVWGYPMADTLFEMTYYSPLLEYQKRLPYRKALLGPSSVDVAITDLILKAVKTKRSILSSDISHFDADTKQTMQKVAFNYFKSLFQKSCHDGLNYIENRFQNIGLITPYGIMKGIHQTPSGSNFTNEVGSECLAKIAVTVDGINEQEFQVQGDDGVFLATTSQLDRLKKKFRECGYEINESKSDLSQNHAIYLQNLYHMDYLKDGLIGGIYPVYRALNKIIFQERWATFEDYEITGIDYYSIRTICILENCKYHPLFKVLVQFVLKHDKYSLDYSNQGLHKYVHMIYQTSGAGEILKHQYGDDLTGFKSFETVKLIKELS